MLKALIEPFVKYTTAGGLATLVHYAIFLTLVRTAAWLPWQATLLAASVGALVAYMLNYRYTYVSTAKHSLVLPKFLAVAVLGVLIQTLIVAVLCQSWQVQYLLAQIIATAVGLVVTFMVNQFWTFS